MTSNAWRGPQCASGALYRDPENGWLFGVCAGLADRWDMNLVLLRVLAVTCLVFFPVTTAIGYGAAVVLMREKPLIYAGRDNEPDFWRRHRDQWRHS